MVIHLAGGDPSLGSDVLPKQRRCLSLLRSQSSPIFLKDPMRFDTLTSGPGRLAQHISWPGAAKIAGRLRNVIGPTPLYNGTSRFA